jgi:uncharacterized protein involved in exopolysaccharide biosynthesis
MSEKDLDWRDALALLRRRRISAARAAAIAFGLICLAVMALGPSYESAATLMVTATRTRDVSPDANALPTVDRVTEEDLNSQAELLRSDGLIRNVLEPRLASANLDKSVILRVLDAPRAGVAAVYRALHGLPPPTALDDWVEQVDRHLDVQLPKKTNLIRVAYRERGIDPEWAASFVNDLVDRALVQQADVGQQRQATAFFEEQRRVLGERLQAAEAARREFFEREGLESAPEQRVLWQTRLSQIAVALESLDTDRAATAARVEALEKELKSQPETLSKEVRREQNQAVQFLKPRILEKEMERSQLLSLYAPGSERITDVERELAEAKRLLAAEESTFAATTTTLNPTRQALEVDLAQGRVGLAELDNRTRSLTIQLDSARVKIAHLDRVAAEHSRLEQEVQGANEALATYTRKQEQARLSSALDASRIVNVAVVERAEVPTTPAPGHRLLLLAFGVFLSLAIGVAVAVGRDLLDSTVRDASDAEVSAGVPVLGVIASIASRAR